MNAWIVGTIVAVSAVLPSNALTINGNPAASVSSPMVTALYRGGRRAEALAVYRQLRGRLVDEVGLEPAAQLQLRLREGSSARRGRRLSPP